MLYTVSLTGCRGISDSSIRQAEGAFCHAIERALGGSGQDVASAHLAYLDAVRRCGGTPLPLDAEPVDREIVERWEDAYGAGVEAAFVGWPSSPAGAHFEVASTE